MLEVLCDLLCKLPCEIFGLPASGFWINRAGCWPSTRCPGHMSTALFMQLRLSVSEMYECNTYRSRRHQSTSPSRSPSYHSRDRGHRQASHKRPRPSRAPAPTRTGLSSPSQSRDPSREATPALAEDPHSPFFEDSAPPVRASTPKLAGLEVHPSVTTCLGTFQDVIS